MSAAAPSTAVARDQSGLPGALLTGVLVCRRRAQGVSCAADLAREGCVGGLCGPGGLPPRRPIASARCAADASPRVPLSRTIVGAEVPLPVLRLGARGDVGASRLGSTTTSWQARFPVLSWGWRQRGGSGKRVFDARRSRLYSPLRRKAYEVSSPFGPRWGRMHKGVDLATQLGEPVVASDAGVVSFAGYGEGYGQVVEITHDDGWRTLYAHLDRADPQLLGRRVKRGAKVGAIGMSGSSSGPHLHFEVQQPLPRSPLAPTVAPRAAALPAWLATGAARFLRRRDAMEKPARRTRPTRVDYRAVDPALYIAL